MKGNYIRVAAATPEIVVGDVKHNLEQVISGLEEAEGQGAQLVVFPELCLTGYTCQDLFLQSTLVDEARAALLSLAEITESKEILALVGLPWEYCGQLYNVAAAVWKGRILALIPKSHIPNYSEFYEKRYFSPGPEAAVPVTLEGEGGRVWDTWFGSKVLLEDENIPGFSVAAEVCEDLWVPCPPSISHAMAGATVICNLSASNETIGKAEYRRDLVCGQSARLVCGYLYAGAGEGESTQDLVFGGHNLIAENGTLLCSSKRFETGVFCCDLDLDRIRSERRRLIITSQEKRNLYRIITFASGKRPASLMRKIEKNPFVPDDKTDRSKRCEEILSIQAAGLRKRLKHTGSSHAVVGISGGLDSTLALLVAVRAFDGLGLPRDGILSVTMPCFGTTDRTYQNACELTRRLGATLKEVDIKASVTQHFADIGQDLSTHDVTYENAQARERTQVLMDLANQCGGLVVGTGDMSELALGWATYNGDHMSMYGVNASVPKTLVRHLVRYYADTCGDKRLSDILLDILDTPVSPELLPPEDGKISQKTEELVGPYELHDFFLYYVLRFGYHPEKIYHMACHAFDGTYDSGTIIKWMKTFYRRFFSQQFKRSCLPDGPKVGSAALSPRGDLRMPSDASARLWLEEIEKIEEDL